MTETRDPMPPAHSLAAAHGRQVLFYAPDGLLGGTLTCSHCGGSGRQPDMIEHDRECSYAVHTNAARAAPPA